MPLHIQRNIEKLEASVSTLGGVGVVILAVLRSRYFLISLAIYAFILLLFGGYVISTYVPLRGTFGEAEMLLVLPPELPPPPPVQKKTETAESKDVTVSSTDTSAKSAVVRLTVAAPSEFVRTETPQVAPGVKMAEIKIQTDMGKKIELARIQRLVNVREFQKSWGVKGSKRRTRATFTIFQGKYQDGDWFCNPTALTNLMLQVRVWSRNRIKASLHPQILDVGTDQLFTIKPPFVYLTGHKDFRLLDQEVTNIRDYLMLGGAIWADSSLAGRRSRFDVAFRREMKRVLPDRDFEIVKPGHDMFDTFFADIALPTGMNYYQEPVELINIGNELAVLYTLNGYGHFWETRLDKDDKIEWNRINLGTEEKPRVVYVYGPHLGHPRSETRIIYRNIDDKTVNDNYKFAINVIVHLLTRYQKYFKLLPLDLPPSEGMRGRLETKPKKKKEPADGSSTNKPKRVHKRLGTIK